MADQNVVQVVIQATNETGPAFREAADGVERFGRAAKESAEGANTLGGALKEFRADQRQETRMAGFLAQEIASMGIASKGAAMEVTGLISAFALGGGLGLAIEGVKIGVKLLMEAFGEEQKVSKESQKQAEALAQKYDKLAEEIAISKATAGMSAGEAAAWLERHKYADVQQRKIDDLRAAREKLTEVEAKPLKQAGPMLDIPEDIREKARLDLQSQFNAQKDKEVSLARANVMQLEEEVRGIRQKLDAEAVLATRKVEAPLQKKHWEEELKLALEEGKAIAYQRKSDQAMYQKLAEDADKALIKENKETWDEELRIALEEGKAIAAARKSAQDVEQKNAEERDKKLIADLKKTTAEVQNFLRPVGNAATQIFSGIISGSKNMSQIVRDSFKSMATGLVGSLMQMAEQWAASKIAGLLIEKTTNAAQVTSDIPVAAAEAYKSQVGIPYVGPALAAAAAAQATAYMTAQAALASAAGGWDVPTSIGAAGYPTLVHGGEKVLDAGRNAKLDRMLDKGGTGGDVHVHIHGAMDAKSFVGWADRGGADEIVRVVKAAVRDRRL